MGDAGVTLATQTIHNPAEPRHFMRLKPVAGVVRILRSRQVLADSRDAIRLLEVGRDFYDPVLYVPMRDIRAALAPNDHATHCPLKGNASYFDLTEDEGGIVQDKIAWTYKAPFAFAAGLKGLVAFYPTLVTIEERPT